MPKYVEVGQDVIEFPDDMSDADIERVLSGQSSAMAAPEPAPATQSQQPSAKRSIWEEAGRQLGLTARAGVTGLAGLPLMLAEPVAAGVNQLTGREVFPNQFGALQQQLTNLGFPEPESGLERAVQTGASAMAGTGAQAELARRAGGAMFAPLAQNVPQQVAAAGAAGMASQATSEKAAEVGFSPAENFAASLATGLLAGSMAAKGTGALLKPKTPPMTMEQVKQQAGRAYTRVDEAGVSVKPLPILQTVDDIEAGLVKNSNFNPELPAHREVKIVLDSMRKMVGSERVSFTKLDQLRQRAAQLARESNEPAARRLASQVVEGLDKKITSLQPNELVTGKGNLQGALKDVSEARNAWKRVSKANVLEDALNVAEARALDPKASEGELIRTQFKALAANKDKMRLFSKDEQAAIRRVVSGDGGQQLLALMARFNPERSQLMTGMTIGASFGNPYLAGGVAGAGFLSDKALGAVQRRAAQDVISQILSGQIRRPTSNTSWRALVEARAQQYSPAELAQIEKESQ